MEEILSIQAVEGKTKSKQQTATRLRGNKLQDIFRSTTSDSTRAFCGVNGLGIVQRKARGGGVRHSKRVHVNGVYLVLPKHKNSFDKASKVFCVVSYFPAPIGVDVSTPNLK